MSDQSYRINKEPTQRQPTPYPKMLYKGEPIYGDSDQIKEDLQSRKIKTVIVADEEQEAGKRDDGFVDLAALLAPPRTKAIFATEKPLHEQTGDDLWNGIEREKLVAQYVEKHGKKPHHKLSIEKLQAAVA